MLFRGIPAGPCPVLVAVASGLSEPCLAVPRVGCRAFFTGVGCRSRCCRRAFRVYKDTGIPLYSLHVGADFFAFLPGGSRGCAPGSTPVPAAGHRIAPSGAQVCSRAGKGVPGRGVSGLSAPSVRANRERLSSAVLCSSFLPSRTYLFVAIPPGHYTAF